MIRLGSLFRSASWLNRRLKGPGRPKGGTGDDRHLIEIEGLSVVGVQGFLHIVEELNKTA